MADVKTLFRDTAREEYFYRLGFQEGYKAGKREYGKAVDAGWSSNTEFQLEAATGHAREQVIE